MWTSNQFLHAFFKKAYKNLCWLSGDGLTRSSKVYFRSFAYRKLMIFTVVINTNQGNKLKESIASCDWSRDDVRINRQYITGLQVTKKRDLFWNNMCLLYVDSLVLV